MAFHVVQGQLKDNSPESKRMRAVPTERLSILADKEHIDRGCPYKSTPLITKHQTFLSPSSTKKIAFSMYDYNIEVCCLIYYYVFRAVRTPFSCHKASNPQPPTIR